MLLDVTPEGAASGAAVEGSQVLTALDAAEAKLGDGARRFVGKAHARVVLRDLGTEVRVSDPAAAEVLPRHPAPSDTCPANR